jgi:uncharacterized surface protein with fasciclin (FAS1) repeats
VLDPVRIAAWWLVYDSPVNDLLCRQPVRFHRSIRDETAWKRVEEQSFEVVERIVASRGVLKVCRALRIAGLTQGARLLATALLELDLAKEWITPSTLFVPTDQAFEKLPAWRMQMLLSDWDGHRLRRFLDTHRVAGHVELGNPWSADAPELAKTWLESVGGAPLELDTSGDAPRVGTARVIGQSFDIEGVRIYPMDAPLQGDA